MLKARETLISEVSRAGFDPSQAMLLSDIIDSAWQWREGAVEPVKKERWVTVGGQRVKGVSADEKATIEEGGQSTVPTVPSTGATGPQGPIGPQGLPGATGPAGPIINHDQLPGLDAGDFQHLLASAKAFLTGGASTDLHFHDADRDRTNHTGYQPISTVTGLQDELDAKAWQAPIDDGKLLSGFVDNGNITVSYSVSQRKITLTHPSGTIRYHFRGREKELASPWVSDAHSNTIANWFLYSTDGETFGWSNSQWAFEDVMIAYVRKGTNLTFAIREVHGLMDPNAHRIAHANIGTYVVSGGTLTPGTWALVTATDAANTPGIDATIVSDEDILSNLPAVTEGSYRVCYPVSTTEFGVSDLTRPFSVGASYIQWYNGTTATEGATGKFYAVYAIALPTTADAESQLNRWLWVAPQAEYSSLALAQAATLSEVNLCDLTLGITEYVPRMKIIYGSSAAYGSTGKVRIESVNYLVKGTSATAVAAGTTVSWNNLADIPEPIGAIDGLTPSADKFAYYTGANTAALATVTPFIRTFMDDIDAATARATLGAAASLDLAGYLPLTGGTLSGGLDSLNIKAREWVRSVRAGSDSIGSGPFMGCFWDDATYRGGFLQLGADSRLNLYIGNATQTAWVNMASFNTDGSASFGSIYESGTLLSAKYSPILSGNVTSHYHLADRAWGTLTDNPFAGYTPASFQVAISTLTQSNWNTVFGGVGNWNSAFSWGDHASVGYWKSSYHPTTLAGYGITDAASSADLAGYLPLSGGTLTGDLILPNLKSTSSVRSVKAGSNAIGSGPFMGCFWDDATYRGAFFQLGADSRLNLYVGNDAQTAWVNTASFNTDGSVSFGSIYESGTLLSAKYSPILSGDVTSHYHLADRAWATLTGNPFAGYTPANFQSSLGFTPVQQGTGTGQTSNAVKIGWSAGGNLLLQVDATDFGSSWPIYVDWARIGSNPFSGYTPGSFSPVLSGDVTSHYHSADRAWGNLTDNPFAGYSAKDFLYTSIPKRMTGMVRIFQNTPATPSAGDAYAISYGAIGEFSSHAGEIAVYNGASWEYILPTDYAEVLDDTGVKFVKNGSNWKLTENDTGFSVYDYREGDYEKSHGFFRGNIMGTGGTPGFGLIKGEGIWIDDTTPQVPVRGFSVDVYGNMWLRNGIGVFGSETVTAKPSVTGSKSSNAALASLLTALASYGLVTDSTT